MAVSIMVKSTLVFPAIWFAIVSNPLYTPSILDKDLSSSPTLSFYAFTTHRRYVIVRIHLSGIMK